MGVYSCTPLSSCFVPKSSSFWLHCPHSPHFLSHKHTHTQNTQDSTDSYDCTDVVLKQPFSNHQGPTLLTCSTKTLTFNFRYSWYLLIIPIHMSLRLQRGERFFEHLLFLWSLCFLSCCVSAFILFPWCGVDLDEGWSEGKNKRQRAWSFSNL